MLQQLYVWNDGDYITIYDITDDGKSIVIASVNGPDMGPISSYYPYQFSWWHKKIISSTSNKMLVEFRSYEVDGILDALSDSFSAFIHYSPLPSEQCENGLNMNMKTIQSPKYPESYDNNLTCKWLISVPHGFHITLKFLQLDVGFFDNFNV